MVRRGCVERKTNMQINAYFKEEYERRNKMVRTFSVWISEGYYQIWELNKFLLARVIFPWISELTQLLIGFLFWFTTKPVRFAFISNVYNTEETMWHKFWYYGRQL